METGRRVSGGLNGLFLCVFLCLQNFIGFVVFKDFPDHVLVVPEHGLAVVVIPPAVAIGLGIAVEHGNAFCFGMDGQEGVLLLGGSLGIQINKPFQLQRIQGRQVLDLGVADVQVFQTFTACQRFDVVKLETEASSSQVSFLQFSMPDRSFTAEPEPISTSSSGI